MRAAILGFVLCGVVFGDFAAGQQAMKNGDHAAALREFLPLADSGDWHAQLYLGWIYAHGNGVVHDDQESVRRYISAAQSGSVEWQNFVAFNYQKGEEGFPLDLREAAKWYRRAAERGDALAQASVGFCYLEGKGVPQDYVLAHMWFNLASGNGEESSRKTRDSVARKMTGEQLAEAQRMAREWRPTTSK